MKISERRSLAADIEKSPNCHKDVNSINGTQNDVIRLFLHAMSQLLIVIVQFGFMIQTYETINVRWDRSIVITVHTNV